MPIYRNKQPFDIYLSGPGGERIRVRGGNKPVSLPEYFDKYVLSGLLVKDTSQLQRKPVRKSWNKPTKVARRPVRTTPVGRRSRGKTNDEFKLVLETSDYPISNGVGVGILSFNRVSSLIRLINSILKFTDLSRTTVFVSDDGSTCGELLSYLDRIPSDIVVLKNKDRLGIAGNSNRLLQCLSRFQHKLLLNDDVEIQGHGWDTAYFDIMKSTGLHHLCYHQPGIYNAIGGDPISINGVNLNVVHERPHGAIMAFDDLAFRMAGYFDTDFGIYGMEHVDWSTRVYELGIQRSGYFDWSESLKYFKIHPEASAVEKRVEHLNRAKQVYGNRKASSYVPNSTPLVPSISCVVPYRDVSRSKCIATVIENIQAQRFPNIEIIGVEEDDSSKLPFTLPILYRHIKSSAPFNKSAAWNIGVSIASHQRIVLHDADMLAPGNYFGAIYEKLLDYEACHIGAKVYYLDDQDTTSVVTTKALGKNFGCNRCVDYYEGGSLGVCKDAYWKIGGFSEDFVGYGCFLPGNQVLTLAGYKPIESVTNSDMLYTHECRFQPISLRQRHYRGEVIDLYVPGRLPIKGVTLEHPFLVQTGEDEFMWREIKDLQKGDVIASTDLIPDLIPSHDIRDIINLDRSKNSFDVFKHMEGFCYLLGLYLADGVIQSPDRIRTIYYYLSEDEEFLARHIERLVKDLHPDINVAYHYVRNGCREVRVFNSLLAKIIKSVAGRFSATQKLLSSTFINTLQANELSALLGGACDGDANHHNGSEKRLVLHTSSFNLAMTYSAIMRRLGVAHSFGRRSGGSFDGSSDHTYDLCVNREFEHIINTVYTKPSYFGSNSVNRSMFGKVYDVKRRQYDGYVYNFEVEDDHSYVVNGMFVHNCEDCDFFARAAGGTKWLEDRTFNLVHLDHPRVKGWVEDHDRNLAIEAGFAAMSIPERISTLRRALITKGYIEDSNG